MVDTSGVDLLGLVSVNTTLRRKASTRGGEWQGACPICGGKDRFHVHPNADPPDWGCRGCNRGGDAIAFVMLRDNCDFLTACRTIGLDPGKKPDPNRPRPRHAWTDEPPPAEWQERARAFIAYAEQMLWGEQGSGALAYLRERRGLSDETIKRWHLGYVAKEVDDRADRWGLEDGRLRIWRGIVIPCTVGPTLWYVKVRRPLPGDELTTFIGAPVDFQTDDKYLCVRGSKPAALFGADTLADHSAGVIVEGEFDAMLLHQEAGDLVGVATVGSAGTGITTRWKWHLVTLAPILVAYDADEAGQTGAAKLSELSACVRLVAPMLGKDLTEMHQGGGDLRAWIAEHLPPAKSAEDEKPQALDIGAEAALVDCAGHLLDEVIIIDTREVAGQTWYRTAGRDLAWTNPLSLRPAAAQKERAS